MTTTVSIDAVDLSGSFFEGEIGVTMPDTGVAPMTLSMGGPMPLSRGLMSSETVEAFRQALAKPLAENEVLGAELRCAMKVVSESSEAVGEVGDKVEVRVGRVDRFGRFDKGEVKPEVKTEVGGETKVADKVEVRVDSKPEIKSEVKPVAVGENKATDRVEVRVDSKAEIKPEIAPVVIGEAKDADKPVVRADRPEVAPEIVKSEIARSEISDFEIKPNVARPEIAPVAVGENKATDRVEVRVDNKTEVKPEIVKSEIARSEISDFEIKPNVARPEVAPVVIGEAKVVDKVEVRVDSKAEIKSEVKPVAVGENKATDRVEVRVDNKAEVKFEVRVEVKPVVAGETKVADRGEVKVADRAEVKPVVVGEAKVVDRAEIKVAGRAEVKSEIAPVVVGETKVADRADVRVDSKAEVKSEVRVEVKPVVAGETKVADKVEVRVDSKAEVKPEIAPVVVGEAKVVDRAEVRVDNKVEIKSEVTPESKPVVVGETKVADRADVRVDGFDGVDIRFDGIDRFDRIDRAVERRVEGEPPVLQAATFVPVVEAPAPAKASESPVHIAPVDVVRVQAANTVLAPAEVLVQAAEAVADTLLVSPGLLKGQGEVIVQLRPDVLDGTEVRIAVTGRQLEVVFQPLTVDMAVLIENCRPQIVQHLAAKISAFNVSVDVRKKRS